jgi:hypothetical protein
MKQSILKTLNCSVRTTGFACERLETFCQLLKPSASLRKIISFVTLSKERLAFMSPVKASDSLLTSIRS